MNTQAIENAFKYCPRCGSSNPEPGSVPFRCSTCGMAQFFGPVAAVGGLIVDDTGRLLLVRRARNPGRGLWGLPGGFVDREETVEEALVREVYEETRLQLAEQSLLATFPNQYAYAGVSAPVIDLFYLCRAADTAVLQLAPNELDHAHWGYPTEKELSNMAFESNRRAIECWLQQQDDADRQAG